MQSVPDTRSAIGPDTWYVQVNGQAYGPYNSMQMQGFCTEGRVNAHSIISESASQGYAPATKFQSFLQWTGQLQPTAQMQMLQPLQNPHSSSNAQVLRPISTPQTGVLAREQTPIGYAPQAIAPNPEPLKQTQIQAEPQANTKTVFIVMAEIRSENGMAFLQTLQGYGTAQRIGDSVWLLKSQASVEQLRNSLSQTLTGDDRLFLLDSFANKTAWFNIGTNMDAKIRELWDMTS